jgi:copper chaperone
MQRIELEVEGMHCGNCEQTIQRAVGSLQGVSTVKADHQARQVIIEGTSPIDAGSVRAAIAEAGFTVVGG